MILSAPRDLFFFKQAIVFSVSILDKELITSNSGSGFDV